MTKVDCSKSLELYKTEIYSGKKSKKRYALKTKRTSFKHISREIKTLEHRKLELKTTKGD